MLVLTRRAGGSIMIGDNVKVTVLSTNEHGEVRVGITAPREIEVHRQEIYQRIQQERASCSTDE